MLHKQKDTVFVCMIVFVAFVLLIAFLFLRQYVTLPPEFYASFAGALVAILFSVLLSLYLVRKQQRLSKATKAQIIQTLMSEIELNLNNISTFIQGCKDGTHFVVYRNSSFMRTLFWPRFLTDYPHPSFELTQLFDMIYGSFLLMEYQAQTLQSTFPEPLRFIPFGASLDAKEQDFIKSTSSRHYPSWRLNIKTMIDYYNEIQKMLSGEFAEYKFKKQLYFDKNNIYDKLFRFCIE